MIWRNRSKHLQTGRAILALLMLRPHRKPHKPKAFSCLPPVRSCSFTPNISSMRCFRSTHRQRTTPVFLGIRALLDESGEFFLLYRQPAGPPRSLAFFKPRQAVRIIAMHPVAQRLAVHPADFGRNLAVLPSSTSAIAGIRRAIFASRTFADAARNSLAVKSFRVISIAAI